MHHCLWGDGCPCVERIKILSLYVMAGHRTIFGPMPYDLWGLVRLFTHCHSSLVPAYLSSLQISRLLERAITRLILVAMAEASSNRPNLITWLFRLSKCFTSGVMYSGSHVLRCQIALRFHMHERSKESMSMSHIIFKPLSPVTSCHAFRTPSLPLEHDKLYGKHLCPQFLCCDVCSFFFGMLCPYVFVLHSCPVIFMSLSSI